ncbi:MAG: hypothetical protein M3Q58_16505 [Bacteroidota bacterium]|nr:hypothetical protein [Bacteroidota bacterium]
MKFNNQANPLIFIVRKRSKHLMVIGLVAIVLSSFFSGPQFIKPKYKSSSVFYPANILPYGQETPVEQALQTLEGNDVRDEIISKYKLAQRYNIDTSSSGYYSEIVKAYNSNVTFKNTRYESVELEVLDTNPLISKEIAVELIKLYNKKSQNLQRKKSKEVLLIYKNHLVQNQRSLDSIENVLQDLRNKYGIIDHKVQIQEVTRGYFSGGIKDKEIEKEAKTLLDNLQNKGGEFANLTEIANSLRLINSSLFEKYSNTLMDVSKELTYSDIVSSSRLPDEKS